MDPDINLPSTIDAEQIGESVRESALPWETIKTTSFGAGESLDGTIDSLTAMHSQRAKQDPNLQYLMRYIEGDREAHGRKTLSLNIDTRREQRELNLDRALEMENERRTALDLQPIESLEDIDDDDRPDVQLDQAAGIVRDLAEMREVESLPAQSAQVNP